MYNVSQPLGHDPLQSDTVAIPVQLHGIVIVLSCIQFSTVQLVGIAQAGGPVSVTTGQLVVVHVVGVTTIVSVTQRGQSVQAAVLVTVGAGNGQPQG